MGMFNTVLPSHFIKTTPISTVGFCISLLQPLHKGTAIISLLQESPICPNKRGAHATSSVKVPSSVVVKFQLLDKHRM